MINQQKLTQWLVMMLLMSASMAWATVGEEVKSRTVWDGASLNSITPSNTFEKVSPDGLLRVTLTGDNPIGWTSKYDVSWASSEDRLTMGKCPAGSTKNFTVAWTKTKPGYKLRMASVRTHAAMCGSIGFFKLGTNSEVSIAKAAGASTSQTENITDSMQTTVGFYYRRGNAGTGGNTHIAYLTKLAFEYFITPDNPTWKNADNRDTTITTINTIHWYDPASQVVTLDTFASTLKFEVLGENAKYVIWNADHTRFYVIKQGDYRIRTYVDAKAGCYGASGYSQEMILHVEVADSEKNTNKIWFLVDGVLATETDPVNGYWDVTLPINTQHHVEYVSVQSDPIIVEFTQHCLEFSDVRPTSAHVTTFSENGTDTLKASMTGSYGTEFGFLRIHLDRTGTNHVTFTINSADRAQDLVTDIYRAAWSTDHNDIELEERDATTDDRYVEVTFTGIPDSLYFIYGSNATIQNSELHIYASNGTDGYIEIGSVLGITDGRESQYRFGLNPSTRKLKFLYTGCQYKGWLKNLTVTERKDVVFQKDTFVLYGKHTPGGKVDRMTSLNWYNIRPTLALTLEQFNADKFSLSTSAVPTALDDYAEGVPLIMSYSLDEPGIHYTTMVARSNDHPNIVRTFLIKGITSYSKDELVIDNPYRGDTIRNKQVGDTIMNPFVLKDTTGNIIKTDSLHYNYQIVPANAAEIDSKGNIIPHCVGLLKVYASSKENMLLPAINDSIILFIPEKNANTISWKIDTQLVYGQVLNPIAVSADPDAKLTYSFSPSNLILSSYAGTYRAGQVNGKVRIIASAAQSCQHFAVSDTMWVTVMGEVAEVKKNDSIKWNDIQVGDTLKNIINIYDDKGHKLTPPAIHTTYEVIPHGAATIEEDGTVIILDKSGDITIIAKTFGDSIKTRYDTIYMNIKTAQEVIYWHLPDTLYVNKFYNLKTYITTRSGEGIDTAYLSKSNASVVVNPLAFTIVATKAAKVDLYVEAIGNEDYVGHPVEHHIVSFVKPLKPINWPSDDDLDDARVGDTIKLDTVRIIDADGLDVTDQVEKKYTIDPSDAAHVDDDGNIIIDKPGDITVIIETSGDGIETTLDTLYFSIDNYTIGSIVWPSYCDQLLIGDTLVRDDIKVYDTKGKDITDLTHIQIIARPSASAQLDADSNLVMIKANDNVKFIAILNGELVNPKRDTLIKDVYNHFADSIQWPSYFKADDVQVGDTVKKSDFKVYNQRGEDITDIANVTLSIEPTEAGHIDENGNLVLDKKGEGVKLTAQITGDGVDTRKETVVIDVENIQLGTIQWPEDFMQDSAHVGDTIRVDKFKVFDDEGNELTDEVDIVLTIDPSTAGHLDEDGNLIIDKPGDDVKITATISGDGIDTKKDSTVLDVTRYKDLLPDYSTILPDTMMIGDTIALPMFTDKGLPIYYSSSDSSALKIEDGKLICTGRNGDVVLTIKTNGNEYYDPALMYEHVTAVPVPKKNDALDFGPLPNELELGETITMPSTSSIGNLPVTYQSSNPSVIKVEGNKLTCISLTFDDVVITASTTGDTYYFPTSLSKTLTVRDTLDCLDVLVQLWNDVLVVNMDKYHSTNMTIKSYRWYRNGLLLHDEISRSYQDTVSDNLSGTYYAVLIDEDGNEMFTCEKVITPRLSKVAPLMRVYPSSVAKSDVYMVETSQNGLLRLVASDGRIMCSEQVSNGKNTLSAPMQNGVYLIQFTAADGSAATDKLIIR